MATFILVHGAFHGGWCWQRVAPLLERAGHRVLAPDLPGSGHDPSPPTEARLSSYAGRIAALIDSLVDRPILVGHDLGSVVCAQVAEQRAWRVVGSVHLAGPMLRSGESVRGLLAEFAARTPADDRAEGPDDDHAMRCARLSADGLCLQLPPAATRELYYHRCHPEDAVQAAARLSPQPAAVYGDPVQLTTDGWGRVPRWYVECTDDQAIPPSLQRRMIERVSLRKVYELDADHAPFLSAPVELAEVLLDVATQLQQVDSPAATTATGTITASTGLWRERRTERA